MSAGHTPGPWAVDADPIEDQDYETLIVLPGPNGSYPTWIARAEHNWKEAGARERRISWAEAQANARLIAAAPDLLAAMEGVMNILGSAESNASGNPEWDYVGPRIAAARAAIAKACGQ